MGLRDKYAKRDAEQGFEPLELCEQNVQVVFNRCGKVDEDGSTDWNEDALKQNKATISYLLGQLESVHKGVTEQELDASFFMRYDGKNWTKSMSHVIHLLNMGGSCKFCAFFKRDEKRFVELKIIKMTPTLSPKDPTFAAWYKENSMKMEAEYAYTRAEYFENKGDYEKAASLYEEAIAKGYEDAKYGLKGVRTISATIEMAAQGNMEAQYALGSFYDVPNATEWLEKAAGQGHKGAGIIKRLLQSKKLTSDDIDFIIDNYTSLSSSVREAYNAYMLKKLDDI